MEIKSLEWHPHNIEKLHRHGINRQEVREMVALNNFTVDVHESYPDQARITGYTRAYRYLTIVLENLGGGVYRPITGWNATLDEIRRFMQETQG